MGDFERDLGDLSYFTSIVVYGTIVFPPVLAASLTFATQCGEVRCAFMLDMASPKIAQKLKVVVDDLSKKTIESITDGLTKVYNRSFFEERLRQEIEAARKSKQGSWSHHDRSRPFQAAQRYVRPCVRRRCAQDRGESAAIIDRPDRYSRTLSAGMNLSLPCPAGTPKRAP